MNNPVFPRQELSQFLRDTETGRVYTWRILSIIRSPAMGSVFDLILYLPRNEQRFWRLEAFETADYVIRPTNPATIMGGPEIRFSTDDPRLDDEGLQTVPGGDGMAYEPRKKFQLLELDQSWIIAVRFEIEPLPQLNVP